MASTMPLTTAFRNFVGDVDYRILSIKEKFTKMGKWGHQHLPKTLINFLAKLRFAVVLVFIGAIVGWFFARLFTLAVAVMPSNPVFGITELFDDPAVFAELFFADIFDLNFDSVVVQIAGVVGLALPFLLGMRAMGSIDFSIEEAGSEYGEERLATRGEMSRLADKKFFFNNHLFSENVWVVFEPWNKATDQIKKGRNSNGIVIGLSGLGKTFNGVMLEIMQAVGNALEPKYFGVKNIPLHVRDLRIVKVLAFTINFLSNREAYRVQSANDTNTTNKNNRNNETNESNKLNVSETGIPDEIQYVELVVPVETPPAGNSSSDVSGHEEKSKETHNAGTNNEETDNPQTAKEAASEQTSEVSEDKQEANANIPLSTLAEISLFRESLKAELGEKKKSRKALLGCGYDIINTDPKGQNLEDTGSMLELANFMIHTFNTIDVSKSDRYNPLSAIKSRKYDVKDPNDISFHVSMKCHGRTQTDELNFKIATNRPVTKLRPFHLLDEVESAQEIENSFSLEASLNLETEYFNYQDDESLSPMDQSVTYTADGETKTLPSYLDEMKERGMREHDGKEIVSDVIRSFNYCHSQGQIDLVLQNMTNMPLDCDLRVKMDRALEIVDIVTDGEGKIGYTVTEKAINEANRTGVLKIEIDNLEPSDYTPLFISFKVEVRSSRMPDGVDLSKNVECLVSQLTPKDGPGADDPFWEDTKRLAFMALISYQFEALPPAYWNLPTTIELLDLLNPEKGCDTSAMDVLMREWERGMRWVPASKASKSVLLQTGVGGVEDDGHWEPTDTPPHERSKSLALHCYYAFRESAEDTVKSVVITCQTAFVKLVSPEMRQLLSTNTIPLDGFGDPDNKRALFLISSDTDHTFDFLLSMLVFQLINLQCDKAYKKYGGKLPRHVRFVLDELANLGNIKILIRALAVVRSRNISLQMYLQSKDQISKVYGDEDTNIMFDNCSNLLFMGAQSQDTLKMFSEKIGNKTVQSRSFQRQFNPDGNTSVSENVQTTGQEVKSAAELSRLDTKLMLVFLYGCRPALDRKFPTERHPLFAYVHPTSKRSWLQPRAVFNEKFDFIEYQKRRDKRAEVMRT